MIIRKLGWAGIEIESDGQRLAIDPIVGLGDLEQFTGPPLTELPPASGPLDAALVTHLHRDHADPEALADVPLVLRPAVDDGEFLETAATTAQEAIGGTVVAPWETIGAGAFTVTAVPAVDGFGDPQVSYAVEADGRRILHCGDTLFHGHWWRIRMRCGPFDAVFLPVNGATCQFPHRAPASPFVADLDPEQAAAAAAILEAPIAVPIHYDTIHAPPVYAQVDDPVGRFAAAAGDRARVLAIGEELALGAATARGIR
jgi:L-ascorbate metabolism protein UlaG (beta-lactamase superfamily)